LKLRQVGKPVFLKKFANGTMRRGVAFERNGFGQAKRGRWQLVKAGLGRDNDASRTDLDSAVLSAVSTNRLRISDWRRMLT
jgi:hypothetical protein